MKAVRDALAHALRIGDPFPDSTQRVCLRLATQLIVTQLSCTQQSISLGNNCEVLTPGMPRMTSLVSP